MPRTDRGRGCPPGRNSSPGGHLARRHRGADLTRAFPCRTLGHPYEPTRRHADSAPARGEASPALRFTSPLRRGPFGLGPMTRVLGQRRPLQNPPIAPPRHQMSRLTSATGEASDIGLEAQCVSEKPTGMGELPAAMSKGRVKSRSVESKDAAGAFRLSQGVRPHSRCACPQGVRRTGSAWAHGSRCVGPRFDRPHASTDNAR